MDATLNYRNSITDYVRTDMTEQILQVNLTVSFEEFYRTEFPGLVAVAAALTGSTESSEDLVQDTMVKSFVRWSQISRLDRPGGWAHRVLLNACTSWFRRRRTEALFLARQRRVEASTEGPTADALTFWTVVRRLPERHRQVMILHYAGDRSVAEVASILKVPEGTVRSDLTRARSALANLLEDPS
jgi:RNA polymerase sigma-70 factor, ECF subfamily